MVASRGVCTTLKAEVGEKEEGCGKNSNVLSRFANVQVIIFIYKGLLMSYSRGTEKRGNICSLK